jgi:hypothetical protein
MIKARTSRERSGKRKSVRPLSVSKEISPLDHAIRMLDAICAFAGSEHAGDDVTFDYTAHPLRSAIAGKYTASLFDWLMEAVSLQGISDYVASGYMDQHGRVTWQDIAQSMASPPSCRKLQSYWVFEGCRYEKNKRTCAMPDRFGDCPLPRHDLRNGRLNQTAYSLFLFIRDVADGDLVGWMDCQLDRANQEGSSDTLAQRRDALVRPLRHVFGVADKVLTMALSEVLLAAPKSKPLWVETGATMTVIDTLVHNFLARTGILRRFNARHSYGPACYRQGGCAEIIRQAATRIDGRRFNPKYPEVFPRFVQHAIWHYCAQSGMDICNGNRIDDRQRCHNRSCDLYSICDRKRPVKTLIM